MTALETQDAHYAWLLNIILKIIEIYLVCKMKLADQIIQNIIERVCILG